MRSFPTLKFFNIHKVPKAPLIYEMAKKNPFQNTDLWNRGPLKVLNDSQLILND